MATEEEMRRWQTDPEAAYAEAERLIAEAARISATELDFSDDLFQDGGALTALRELPMEIAALSNLQILLLGRTQVTDLAPITALSDLQILILSDTQVTDLTPITALSNLQLLYLDNTQVTDLAPITALQSLVEGAKRADHFGLHYANTPVADSNDAFRALVELYNPERTEETLAYLNGEHPVFGGPPGHVGQSTDATNFETALKRPLARVSLGDFGFDELRRVLKMVPFQEEEISADHPSCEAMAQELAAMAKDLHTDIKDSNAPSALSRALSRYATEAGKEISDLLPGRLWDIAETFRDAAFDEDVIHAMPPLTDKQLQRLIDKHLDLMRAVMAPTLKRMGQLEDLTPAPDADPRDVEKALELGAAVVEENAEEVDQYIAAVLRDMRDEIKSSAEQIERISDPAQRESLTARLWTRTKVAGGTLYRLALRGVQIGNATASFKTLAPKKFYAIIEWLKKVFPDIDWPPFGE